MCLFPTISLIPNSCTKTEYKGVLYEDGHSCNIFLSGFLEYTILSHNVMIPLKITHYFWDVYHIKILPCPLGFALNKILLICQCDLNLKLVVPLSESCNIRR